MIFPRFVPILFGFILSGLMSMIVSGIATVRASGLIDGVFGLWMGTWVTSWLVTFPSVLIAAPFTRRIVGRLTRF